MLINSGLAVAAIATISLFEIVLESGPMSRDTLTRAREFRQIALPLSIANSLSSPS